MSRSAAGSACTHLVHRSASGPSARRTLKLKKAAVRCAPFGGHPWIEPQASQYIHGALGGVPVAVRVGAAGGLPAKRRIVQSPMERRLDRIGLERHVDDVAGA